MEPTKLLIPTYVQMLKALSSWLEKAGKTGPDADKLVHERLAPDMFPLASQVRFCCLQAHEGVHRMRGEALPPEVQQLGREARQPASPDEKLSNLRALVARTVEWLGTQSPDALDAGAAQPVSITLPMGITFDIPEGEKYARDWALPQFYFHLVTAYSILRSRGLELGKADYVAHMFGYLRPGTMPKAG